MKTTADYLKEIREKTGAKSDGAAGLALGWSRPATTAYKYNRRAFDNHTCLRVAKELGIPLIQVIADMEVIREHDPKKRADWLPLATPDPAQKKTDFDADGKRRCHFESDKVEKRPAKSLI